MSSPDLAQGYCNGSELAPGKGLLSAALLLHDRWDRHSCICTFGPSTHAQSFSRCPAAPSQEFWWPNFPVLVYFKVSDADGAAQCCDAPELLAQPRRSC